MCWPGLLNANLNICDMIQKKSTQRQGKWEHGSHATKAPEPLAVSQLFEQFDNVVNHASTPLQ